MFSRASAVRAGAHLAVWLPFIFAEARSVNDGWRPVSDSAEIALRSWNVLTAQGPLVGQVTRLGHGLYDPGPLQYWLLALPVHIDPVHGVLWGAALWCMFACSLTIEAAWSAAGMPGGLLAAAVILGALAWMPEITMLPCWNPWFGTMFYLAAAAACVATLCGHRWWWPVLVITGSIAAQAHLMFTISALVLVLLGLGVGLADTFRATADYRWAATGLIAGLACWSAPLIQEFTARPGNLTALVRGLGTPGSQAGTAFGLKALAASAQPPPFWWMPAEAPMRLSLIGSRSAVAGVVILVLAIMVLAAACSLRSRHAVALAAVSLTVTVTTMIMYSHIPRASIAITTPTANNLRYLMAPMFAVGVLSWLAAGVVLVLAGRRAVSRLPSSATARGDGTAMGAPRIMAASWAVRIIGLSAVIIGLASFVGVEAVNSPIFQNPAMRDVSAAFQQVGRDIPGRRIMLSVVGPNKSFRRQVTFGLAYALQAVGYRPEVMTTWAMDLGSAYVFHGKPMTHVTVSMRGDDLSVAVTHPRPGRQAASGGRRGQGPARGMP